MTTVTRPITKKDSNLNKAINNKLDNSKYRQSDFQNPYYSIVDYRYYDRVECKMAFRTHEDAKYWVKERTEFNTVAEVELIGVNAAGLFDYMTREWVPQVHTFNTRKEAYEFLKSNPDIINSHNLEF